MEEYRVLVVDDSKPDQLILKGIIEDTGYVCTSVSSGEEALDIVQKVEFHCILLDIVLPKMGGFEVIRKLKDIPNSANVPVVFICGGEGEDVMVRGFEEGAVDFIKKPFISVEVKLRTRSQVRLFAINQSLAKAQSDMIKQLNSAQQSLLKKTEDIPQANFSVYYRSLHAVGGDIYDIVEVSDNKIGYFVGDFAGHAISTSFLTSSIKALLHQNCDDFTPPAQSMSLINTILCDIMSSGQYLTACYAEINQVTGELIVVNMGHPSLILITGDGCVEEMGRPGDILGAYHSALYREDKVKLLPGDRCVLYTDGLIEGEKVWRANTSEICKYACKYRELSRDDFINSLLDSTVSCRGKLDDDIILLVFDLPGDKPSLSRETDKDSITITFNSASRMIASVVNEINKWISNIATEINHYGLKLILYEAITNAVKHGNNELLEKLVVVKLVLLEKQLRIKVTDQGEGFDWKKRKEDKLVSPSATEGRGLHLFTNYGFEFSYNEKGNELTLVKDI